MTPILLTWNLPAKKAAKARMLAMRSGVRVAAVETWQYLQPLGSFTGDCGSMESLYDGAGFSEEMLLFAHFPELEDHRTPARGAQGRLNRHEP